MASNVQAGTRGLSAGDWVRLKRLNGSKRYLDDSDDKDITNPKPTLIETTHRARRVFTEFGISKIRRPASFWTEYRAAQTGDYVLERQDANSKSRILTANAVCSGDKVNSSCEVTGVNVVTHSGICITCKHEKRTNLQPLAQQPRCISCGS